MRLPCKIFSVSLLLTVVLNTYGQSSARYSALIGVREGGSIKKGELLAQQGVRGMRLIADNHWESIPVDSFSIIVLRDSVTILSKRNTGAFFTESLKSDLKNLTTNDKIIIYRISARDYGDKQVSIRPLEFTVL
jgi:hypothetical protein